MSESLERLAHNQALFREVNERIQYLGEVNERIGYSAEGATSEFVCECGSTECISTIELTVVEYERVRSNPTWFVISRITTLLRSRGLSPETTGSRLSRG